MCKRHLVSLILITAYAFILTASCVCAQSQDDREQGVQQPVSEEVVQPEVSNEQPVESPQSVPEEPAGNVSAVAAPEADTAAAQPQPLASPSADSKPAQRLVTAIEVRGNKSISTSTILAKLKTRIGSPYQENIINEDLKRLYLLGFFTDTTAIDTEEYRDGVKVIIKVEERPLIEKIIFNGIRRLRMNDQKLKEQLKTREMQYVDYPKLAEDVQILSKMYEKIGYKDARISYDVKINNETSKATVEFSAVEGRKLRLKDIFVRGNRSYPARRIIRLMKTRTAWLFNAGVLKDETLKEDMERLKAFYLKEGFADVKAEYEVKAYAEKSRLLYINIFIEEGAKYLVGSVMVQGNKDIETKDLTAKIANTLAGKVYSQEAMKQDVAAMQGVYFDRGYISAKVRESTSLNPENGRVDIQYNITENQITFVDRIKIRGNIKTRDTVIRREMRIRPGERFDGEKLRRSRERLQNLGYFEDVAYDTEDTAVPDKKNLVVDVKETKTGSFSFGGGYSTVDKLVGFVEVEQKNFDWKNFPYFTGGGQNLKARAELGTLTQGYDIGFTEPWLYDYPVSFGFDLYKRRHDRDTGVGYAYNQDVIGGDVRLGRELAEYLRGDITYRRDWIKISDVIDNASQDLKREEGRNTVSSLTPALAFDTRDNVFDPHRGDLVSASVEWAGGPLGGTRDFWKYFSRVSHYFPLPRESALEARARIGLAAPYSDSDIVPIFDRFFAGGAATIRGYDERQVGPLDSLSGEPVGGDALLVGNLEYVYPLINFLKAAVFYDIGNVWAKKNDIGAGGFVSSVGMGFRIKTPIGPIRLDYGVPLDKLPGEESRGNGKVHFSAGSTF